MRHPLPSHYLGRSVILWGLKPKSAINLRKKQYCKDGSHIDLLRLVHTLCHCHRHKTKKEQHQRQICTGRVHVSHCLPLTLTIRNLLSYSQRPLEPHVCLFMAFIVAARHLLKLYIQVHYILKVLRLALLRVLCEYTDTM